MKFLTKLTAIVIVILMVIIGSAPVLADRGPDPEAKRYVIHFKPGVDRAEKDRECQKRGARFEREIESLSAYVVYMSPGRAAEYSSAVASIEPDYEVSVDITPNDPSFSQEWGLIKVQAPQAWDVTQGSPAVKIAILDTGIDLTHPDLAAKIVASRNFTTSTNPGDVRGHGTHVSGIAAAVANNSVGVVGLGYNSSLMNVKVLGDTGTGYHSDIAAGVIWATDNGANVINMSMGSTSSSTTMRRAVEYAWNHGVVVVAAAGNSATTAPSYPAYYPQVIAVAATDQLDRLYSFSNYGDWVDVAAPGNALSTLVGGGYGYKSGTSMASPHVAGLAGLALAVAKDANGDGKLNDDVRAIIQSSADNIGVTGIGSGRINAYKTVTAVAPAPTTGTITGTVSNAVSLGPISGATITDGVRTTTTNTSGSYTLANVPAGTYTLTTSAAGYTGDSMSVTLAAGQTVTANFALNPLNRPPVLSPIGARTATEGQLLQFTVTASDPDGDLLVYSASNLPPGASFNTATHLFSWTPAAGQAGTYPNVGFAVSDGKAMASELITVTVNRPATNTMWVESAAFTVTGGTLGVKMKVVNPDAVSGARMRVYLYYNGNRISSSTRTSNSSGDASFSVSLRGNGQYQVVVNRLTHNGYTWDRSKGITSATYTR